MATDYTWKFTTNSAIAMTLTLPVLESTSLAFGTAAVGVPSPPKTVAIASTGTSDLIIGNISITGADAGHYHIESDACSGTSLPAGETCTVRVVFWPASAGPKNNAKLRIESSDPGQSVKEIGMSGTGTTALICFASAPTTWGPLPISVAFTDESFNNPTSWFWEFGDGGSSTLKNPRHTYRTPGLYTVSLTVSNAPLVKCTVPNAMNILACGYGPVRVGQNYRQTPQEAYQNAPPGSVVVIEMQALEFDGALTLNRDVSVTLSGGFDCDYTATLPETVIRGTVTVSGSNPAGTVTVDRVTVQ
jgi:hypothetical protein